MKSILSCAFIFLMAIARAQTVQPEKPIVSPSKILKDGMSLLYYNRDYLRLSEDFTAYNLSGKKISKLYFFQSFASGNYLPLRLESKNGGNYYQLYKLNASVNNQIRSILKSFGSSGLKHYRMEGKVIPDFNFTDINGKVYNPATTKGKIVVLKCWFLACQACNEEIPALNDLVDKFKKRNDIVFISLAFDQKKDLITFSKKHIFKYALVPVKESYIENRLGVHEYPTHFVINKQGLIVKVVNDPNELVTALNNEALK